jgi:cytochrome c-type biogenesis protein CcmH
VTQAMTIIPYLGFAVLALAAIGFASFALWRGGARKARLLLGGAIALFLVGVGGGTYWMLGQPGLAVRSAAGTDVHDVKTLIPLLIARVRKFPGDEQAWIYLGRAYLTAGDADDGAKAYARAITLTRLAHTPDPTLISTYGQILVAQSGGAVSADAEAAFSEAFRLNPTDIAARYYLGQARAMRGDGPGATAMWQSLLADLPPGKLRQALLDRIAMMTAQTMGRSGAAPDPTQMVASLAAELKASPDDPLGWQRLIRAYTVLGQMSDAKTALGTARHLFAKRPDVLQALTAEAGDLKLQ